MDDTFSEFFTDISKTHRQTFMHELSKITFIAFPRGATIYTSGTQFDGIYIIYIGAAKTFIETGEKEVLTAFSFYGDVLGLDSLDSNTYESKAVAAEETTAMWIPSECLATLLNVSAHFRAYLGQAMGRAMAETTAMICLLAKSTAEARVAYLLLKFSKAHQHKVNSRTMLIELSRADMASHLGLRFETVSRHLVSLSKRGHVVLSGRAVQVRNSTALMHICGSLTHDSSKILK